MPKFIDSAVFLVVCTAVLFSWSTANYNGFLLVAGLDTDMMERSFHQVIYSGFILSFGPVVLILIILLVSLYLYSHAILPAYVDLLRGSYKLKRKAVKIRNFLSGERETPELERKAKIMFNRFAIVCVVATAFISGLVYFEMKGQSGAKKILQNHLKGIASQRSMISVKINDTEKTLRYLSCGSKNCAGIEEKTNKVYYFSESSGFSFVHDFKNIEVDK